MKQERPGRVITQRDAAVDRSPKTGGPERGRKHLGELDKEWRPPRSWGRQVSKSKPACRPRGSTLWVRVRFSGCNNLEMIMTTYAFLMLLTLVAAYLAVLVYRRFSESRLVTEVSVPQQVKEPARRSRGGGQRSPGMQQGFIRTKKRSLQPSAKSKSRQGRKPVLKPGNRKEETIKRPWGW